MTNETALVILDDIFKKEERFKDKELYIELVAVYRNALEKVEKYRWHDLRKNPDDLPQDNTAVFVHCKDGYQSFVEYYKGFNCHNDCYRFRFDDVIAWKYIEPFENVVYDL